MPLNYTSFFVSTALVIFILQYKVFVFNALTLVVFFLCITSQKLIKLGEVFGIVASINSTLRNAI